MGENRIVCFHHNDRDGYMSAAIVKYFRKEYEIIFIESCYHNNKCIDYINKLTTNDIVYIVDFSFDIEKMEEIVNNSAMVIWIDHHESAIDKFKNTKFNELPGIRYFDKDYPLAGCELTWKYFSDEEMPTSVKLIGSYDTWRYTTLGEENVLDFYFGTYNYLSVDKMFELLESIDVNLCKSICEIGKSFQEYTHGQYKLHMRNAFEVEFEGYKILALNSHTKSSLVFGDKIKEYPFVSVFNYTGNVYSYSLYSNNPDIHVNKIAEKYSGGGHKGAAGFVLNYNIFDNK